jgi:arabinogalactan oligomer/maltooligosaccharide transport system substrate-binding protein
MLPKDSRAGIVWRVEHRGRPNVALCYLLAVMLLVTSACRGRAPERVQLNLGTAWEAGAALVLHRQLLEAAKGAGPIDVQVHALSSTALYDYLFRHQTRGDMQSLDLAVVPSEWLGTLADRGILAEVPSQIVETLDRRVMPQALLAARTGEAVLGLPIGAEVHALVYNPRFFPREPRTLEEILSLSLPRGVLPIALDISNAHHLAPFVSSLQGPLARSDGSFGWQRASLLESLVRLSPIWQTRQAWSSCRGDGVESLQLQLFVEGRLASFVAGPWMLDALESVGAPYAVMPVPPFASTTHTAAALVSYQCIAVLRRSPWSDLAFELSSRLLDDGPSRALNQAARRLPVLQRAYRVDPSATPGYVGFLRAHEDGQGLPNTLHWQEHFKELSAQLQALSRHEQPPSHADLVKAFGGGST